MSTVNWSSLTYFLFFIIYCLYNSNWTLNTQVDLYWSFTLYLMQVMIYFLRWLPNPCCVVYSLFMVSQSHYAHFKVCACVGTHRYRGYQGVGGQVLLEIAWLLPKRPHARIMQGPKVHQSQSSPSCCLPLNTPGPISCVIVFPVSSVHFGGYYTKRITYFGFREKKWVKTKEQSSCEWICLLTMLPLWHTNINCNQILTNIFTW